MDESRAYAAQTRYYAQWAVRRIGVALAIATFGPVLLFAGLLVVSAYSSEADGFDAVLFLGSAAIIGAAVLSLCFAKAPH